MKFSRVRTAMFVLACFGLAGVGLEASPQDQGQGKKKKGAQGGESTTATTYSGRATVIKASVAGVGTTICDTGELPESGGCLDASLLNANVAGLVSGSVCHATTVGQGNYSRAEASLGNVNLTVAGFTISASFCMSRANATCDGSGNASASGHSEITALSVNQVGIQVTGAVNQENVAFQGLRIIINEQITAVDGNCASITVNALHVICTSILGVTLADVVISSAHADICCGGSSGGHLQPSDRITGGGFITGTPSGAKGNFGVAGGIKNGSFWGHLNYIDHGTGMHVKHVTITGYAVSSTTERQITGTCTINGTAGFSFSCFVADNGEPGTNDTFNLFLSNGYSAGGFLQGGNIQLHK